MSVCAGAMTFFAIINSVHLASENEILYNLSLFRVNPLSLGEYVYLQLETFNL